MTSSWPHHNVILSNILRKLYLDIYFFVFSIVFLFLSTIIVRKKQKQKIHICYFHFFFSCFQILFFTLCTLILINESIIMFGYSMQSLQINCSFLWSFLHKTFGILSILFLTYGPASPFQSCKILTNNSFHTFKASTRSCIEILRFWASQYLADFKNTPYFIH